jgi:predicted transcriptional regulator
MPSRDFYFDPHARGTEVFLGPTEAALMELAWKHRQLTAKEASFHLKPDHPLAYTTVMTVMSRLANKGLLFRHRDGRHHVYEPAVERDHFIRERLKLIASCLEKNFPAKP